MAEAQWQVSGTVAARVAEEVLGPQHRVTLLARGIALSESQQAEERFYSAIADLPDPERSRLLRRLEREIKRERKRWRKARADTRVPDNSRRMFKVPRSDGNANA